jgi:hypothetical protein
MSTDRTNLKPDDLSVAAIKAVGTENASAPKPVTPPTAAGTSPIDLAAGLAAGAVTTLTTAVNAADTKAATTQATALTTSPPVLVQQDQQGADDIIVASAPLKTIHYPTKKAFTAPALGGTTSV